MPVCIIALMLVTNKPIYFNVNRITNVHTEQRPFSSEVTVVNKWYDKESPEQVVAKIKECK